MSYVIVAWSVVAACALLLALMYGLVWTMNRESRASLAFACVAIAIVGSVVVELGMMHAIDAASWGEWVRWSQVPIFLRVSATAVFIRLYFGTGRDWLMWTIIALRLMILVAGFSLDPNFNFSRIDSIEHISFLGEIVTVVGQAQVSPWQWIATSATMLLLIYVADASITLWRKGTRESRRKALVVGGATLVSVAAASLYTQLMILGGARIPVLLAPPFLVMLAAMTFELSRDTLRASRLARELMDSEERLELAASAAGLGLWKWDASTSRIWATSRARGMFEIGDREGIAFERVRTKILGDDLAHLEGSLRHAMSSDAEVEVNFRIHAGGGIRLLLARGRTQTDERGKLVSIQGVLRDVTEQSRAREENEELRRELAHAGRVSVLGTLSSSLAHELSQPLGAILLNAEAAELLLQRPNPDLEELRHILADIQRDDRRAAEVIDGLRALLKRRQLDLAQVSLQSLVHDVAMLLKTDAIARNVVLDHGCDAGIPPVRGDKVHLSQVLINMVVNGMDAVAHLPAALRRVTVRARSEGNGHVELTVADSGRGVAPELMHKIFEPFFTTKEGGMGMGLSVSRTIVEAHGGRLTAENAAGGGATFRVTLPAQT